jgi:hypothetical protein
MPLFSELACFNSKTIAQKTTQMDDKLLTVDTADSQVGLHKGVLKTTPLE